jgi:hypothetical protein
MRACWVCSEPIFECMGFVAAGDLTDFLEGKRTSVRETCGGCILRCVYAEEMGLPRPFPYPNEEIRTPE